MNTIPKEQPKQESYYATWSPDSDPSQVMNALSEALDSSTAVHRDDGRTITDRKYRHGHNNGHHRDNHYGSYDSHCRPYRHHDIMRACDDMYYDCSIIRNMIDLMSEFTCQGIRIVHPVKRHEKFFNNWFKRVSGKERSERFANYLYRYGNITINKKTGRLSKKQRRKIYSVGEEKVTSPKYKKNIIPTGYQFLNPRLVDVEGGENMGLIDNPRYYLNYSRNDHKKVLQENLSPLKTRLKQSTKELFKCGKIKFLNKENTLNYFYKKDDWCAWSIPLLYSLWDDIQMLKKLERSDRAALDGAISNIRVFKLGALPTPNMPNGIMPQAAAINKLHSILSSNARGGTIDIIWGPDLEVQEIKSELYKYLDPEKYTHHMNKIYQGLGIPTTLAGSSDSAGSTNNFISLKTLLQRLEYGRSILNEFWCHELEHVRQAVGIAKPARIEYDVPNLTDDQGRKALLVQLADRNLISDELIQKAFDHDPEMEKIRMKRENKERDDQNRIRRLTPYDSADFEKVVLKSLLNQGLISPSALNINIDPSDVLETDNDSSGPIGQGRPVNSRDSEPRKRREFRPISGLSNQIWAATAQEMITEFVKPIFLKHTNKSSIRALSSDETKSYEELKVAVLFNLDNTKELGKKELSKALSQKINSDLLKQYNDACKETADKLERHLTNKEKNYIQCVIHAYK